jgi:NAD binding domain of 6-phosphogluconate dehydrogenase
MTGAVGGFIGVGSMGQPMALHLLKAGFSLVVHDIDPARVEPLRVRGAAVANSPEAVARATGRTIGMVKELETALAKQPGVPLLRANVTQQVYQGAGGWPRRGGWLGHPEVLERLDGVRVG